MRRNTQKCGSLAGEVEAALGMSSSVSSELLATYAGLGTHDGEHYYKGEECLGKTLSQITVSFVSLCFVSLVSCVLTSLN